MCGCGYARTRARRRGGGGGSLTWGVDQDKTFGVLHDILVIFADSAVPARRFRN